MAEGTAYIQQARIWCPREPKQVLWGQGILKKGDRTLD